MPTAGMDTGSHFPIELLRIAQSSYEHTDGLRQRLMSYLPPIEVATTLVDECMFRNCSFDSLIDHFIDYANPGSV